MNEHWKAVSNYIIALLSMLVILVIAWLVKKYLIADGVSNSLGVAGLVCIISGLLASESNMWLAESRDALSPKKLNSWFYFIFLVTGFFLMLLWLL